MSLVSSTFTEGPAQIDGRRYVTERHADTAGNVYVYEWLGNQDAQAVLDARAVVLASLLAKQEAAQTQVAGTRLPLSKLAFRELFTQSERAGIDAFQATFESNPALSSEQKSSIRTGLEDYKVAESIKRPFDQRVLGMLGLYQSLGLITSARLVEIGAAGNE